MPRIQLQPGGVASDEGAVAVPKVWDPAFLPLYAELLEEIARRYDADERVTGIQVGLGHLGTWNAQPSKDGADKFQQAGWNLLKWENYITQVIDLYQASLTKPLLLETSRGFLGSRVKVIDQLATAQRIVGYAALRGVSVMLNGVDPDMQRFQEGGIPALVSHLGMANAPTGFQIVFTDDWPLWKESPACPGPTCGRDVNGFERELRFCMQEWDKIDRRHAIGFAFLEPEASATNSTPGQNADFTQAVVDVAKRVIFELPPPSISGIAVAPTSDSATFRWRTDRPATSQVEYRPDGERDWIVTPEDPTLVTSHTVTLAGLLSGTKYVARVRSVDRACHTASAECVFKTRPVIEGAIVEGDIVTRSGQAASGRQAASGVTVQLIHLASGRRMRFTVTDSDGRYSFRHLQWNAAYRVHPASTRYDFTPRGRDVTADRSYTDVDFTAVPTP